MSLSIDLTGKVVIVTGASGGIGSGIARRFAAAGATVAPHYHRDGDGAAQIAAELETTAFGCDLTLSDGPAALVAEVTGAFGRLDVVVNNAGIQPNAELATVTDEEWDAMLATNVTAVHRLTQAAAAEMTDGGSITHISSIEGSIPAPNHGHYAVSKAAVIMHAKAAALEWGTKGIRVNTVSPGLIHRDGIESGWPSGVARWQAAAPLGRLGTPNDIGDACVFLASDMAQWITGVNLVVDGGVSTHPSW